MNLHSKQQEAQRMDFTEESQSCGCWSSRTTKDDRTGQKKLLVARTQRKHQEIHVVLYKMSTKQDSALMETRRTSPIGDTTRTMAENQYQYNWTIAQV